MSVIDIPLYVGSRDIIARYRCRHHIAFAYGVVCGIRERDTNRRKHGGYIGDAGVCALGSYKPITPFQEGITCIRNSCHRNAITCFDIEREARFACIATTCERAAARRIDKVICFIRRHRGCGRRGRCGGVRGERLCAHGNVVGVGAAVFGDISVGGEVV